MSGTIRNKKNPSTINEQENFDISIRDDSNNDMFKLEEFLINRTYDRWYSPSSCSETNSGRFYMANSGFVDVTQSTPFVYSHFNQFNTDIPDSGGPLLISGAGGTKMKLTPLSISEMREELDTNGDGIYEINTNILWTDLSGIVFKFEKAIGTDAYEQGNSVAATSDGGYIVTGSTNSAGADSPDVYLVKANAAGDVQWQKTFGGPKGQVGSSVLETADHGFIIAGYTYPTGFTYAFGFGGEEIYLIRTDAGGNLLWEKKFGGPSQWAYSIVKSPDGGFLIMGGITPSLSTSHLYLLKISSSGEKEWDRTLGTEIGNSLAATADGGYVVAGYTTATWYDCIYLLKTDANGNTLWERTINKKYNARASSVLATSSGNYIVTGVDSNTGYAGSFDATGKTLWEKTFENIGDVSSAAEGQDGGIVFAANLNDISTVSLIKTDSQGVQQWRKSTHGIQYNLWPYVSSIRAANDGGYVLVGYIESDKQNSYQKDMYLVKTDKDGNTQ